MPGKNGAQAGDYRWRLSFTGHCRNRGMTLLEVTLASAIVGVMSMLAVPAYSGYIDRANITQAVSDIGKIQLQIAKFSLQINGAFPESLDEINQDGLLDPWGNPYRYLNIETAPNQGAMRKDRNLVPINTDFDLYSIGKDGRSVSALTAKLSRDDIVRANNGNFIGLGEDY